jgi:hypothetical protein
MRVFTSVFRNSSVCWAMLMGMGLVIATGLGSRAAGLVAQEPDEAPPKVVTVEPLKEFSITVSTNPSTGYTTGLAHLPEGVFLLRTEIAKPAKKAPPGAPVNQVFHFFHRYASPPEDAPEIIFGSFQQWDLEETYREEKYVLSIKEAPATPKGPEAPERPAAPGIPKAAPGKPKAAPDRTPPRDPS